MLGRLLQPLLAGRHGPDLAGQPHLAEHHQILGQGVIAKTGDHGQQQSQIRTGLLYLDSADHVDEDILIRHLQPAVAMQHCQQHGEPIVIHPHRHPAWIGELGVVHQRLQLHQQRTRALPDHHHDGAGRLLLTATEEDGGRVAHFPHPLPGHGEDPQLVDRPEAVLVGAQGAKAGVVAAVEQHGTVDAVLQHLGTGQGAILGHVAHHEDGDVILLGIAGQQGGRFPHLGDGPRRRLHIRHMHHLNGVDDHDLRLLLLGNQADLLDRGLRQHAQLVGGQAETRCPHRHLLQRLLTGDVQGLHPLGQATHGLQQQGRLARPRVATDQDGRPRHHAAAKHPIQLLEAGRETGDLGGGDLRQRLHLAADGAGIAAVAGALARGHRAETHLADGVPLLALTALALPACEVGATFGTNIGSFVFGHG